MSMSNIMDERHRSPSLIRRSHKLHHPSVYVGYKIEFEHLSTSTLLGSGGFGKVFKAKYFGQTVAVKEIHSDIVDTLTKSDLDDIEHECMLHYHLRHENIVQLLCFNTELERGPISMVMMQMATSIFDLLHDDIPPSNVKLFGPNFDKPLSLKIRLNMLLETLIGLEFLHVNNVLHLDVKSMNLMITESGQVKINDFGLSLVKEEVSKNSEESREGDGLGSLPWMAPEIIEQEPPTSAADIFSFQVVMFELITGQLPHAERSPQMIVKFMSRNKRLPLPDDDIEKSDVEGLSSFGPLKPGGSRVRREKLPSDLREIYKECGRNNPEERPCASDIIPRLELILKELPEDRGIVEEDDEEVMIKKVDKKAEEIKIEDKKEAISSEVSTTEVSPSEVSTNEVSTSATDVNTEKETTPGTEPRNTATPPSSSSFTSSGPPSPPPLTLQPNKFYQSPKSPLNQSLRKRSLSPVRANRGKSNSPMRSSIITSNNGSGSDNGVNREVKWVSNPVADLKSDEQVNYNSDNNNLNGSNNTSSNNNGSPKQSSPSPHASYSLRPFITSEVDSLIHEAIRNEVSPQALAIVKASQLLKDSAITMHALKELFDSEVVDKGVSRASTTTEADLEKLFAHYREEENEDNDKPNDEIKSNNDTNKLHTGGGIKADMLSWEYIVEALVSSTPSPSSSSSSSSHQASSSSSTYKKRTSIFSLRRHSPVPRNNRSKTPDRKSPPRPSNNGMSNTTTAGASSSNGQRPMLSRVPSGGSKAFKFLTGGGSSSYPHSSSVPNMSTTTTSDAPISLNKPRRGSILTWLIGNGNHINNNHNLNNTSNGLDDEHVNGNVNGNSSESAQVKLVKSLDSIIPLDELLIALSQKKASLNDTNDAKSQDLILSFEQVLSVLISIIPSTSISSIANKSSLPEEEETVLKYWGSGGMNGNSGGSASSKRSGSGGRNRRSSSSPQRVSIGGGSNGSQSRPSVNSRAPSFESVQDIDVDPLDGSQHNDSSLMHFHHLNSKEGGNVSNNGFFNSDRPSSMMKMALTQSVSSISNDTSHGVNNGTTNNGDSSAAIGSDEGTVVTTAAQRSDEITAQLTQAMQHLLSTPL